MTIDDLEIFDNAAHGLDLIKQAVVVAKDAFEEVRAERDKLRTENAQLKGLVRNARVVEPSSMGLSNIYLIDGVDWDRLKAAVEDDT